MYSNCINSFTLHNSSVAPSEPQQLKAYSVTSTTVTLQWKPPKYPNGIITQYSIYCDGKSVGDFESNTMMATIEELLPDTVYVIGVKAYTRVGVGPPFSLLVKTCELLHTHSGTMIRISSRPISTTKTMKPGDMYIDLIPTFGKHLVRMLEQAKI